jgi:tRNA/tmRNA/rRNA uracil-C5-methylase (TrmA/RlmC/RlmD family)
LLAFRADRADKEQAHHLFDLFHGLPDVAGLVVTSESNGRRRLAQRWVTGQDWIADRLGDPIFRISDRSFMQANWRLNELLSRTVADWAGAAPGLRVLELYAGVGTLGLTLARAGALVTLVEANPYTLADARHAAKSNHIGRCRFRPLLAEVMLETVQPGEYDLVLVDPPRTGLSQECLRELLRIGTARLLYLSCDPATLARDLGRLCAGGYRTARLQPFDMFPQTAHLEALVELER